MKSRSASLEDCWPTASLFHKMEQKTLQLVQEFQKQALIVTQEIDKERKKNETEQREMLNKISLEREKLLEEQKQFTEEKKLWEEHKTKINDQQLRTSQYVFSISVD